MDVRTGAPLGEKMFKTEDYGKFLQKNIHDEEIIGIFQATETMSMTPQIYFIGGNRQEFLLCRFK